MGILKVTEFRPSKPIYFEEKIGEVVPKLLRPSTTKQKEAGGRKFHPSRRERKGGAPEISGEREIFFVTTTPSHGTYKRTQSEVNRGEPESSPAQNSRV